jgi:hypothetical protein
MLEFRVDQGTQIRRQLEPCFWRICVPFVNRDSWTVTHEVGSFKQLIHVLAYEERLVQIYLVQRRWLLQRGLLLLFVNLKGVFDVLNEGCLVVVVTPTAMTLCIVLLIRKPFASWFEVRAAFVSFRLILDQGVVRIVFRRWCLDPFL